MLRSLAKPLVITLIFVLSPVLSAAVDMDPAPAEFDRLGYKRKPGEFKRGPGGLIDPSPDVVSLQNLPLDSYGFVDWTKAIRDGIISPKEKLNGGPAPEGETNSQDILIRSKLDFMPDVIFPHAAHTEWLKCSTCHPKIFRRKAGATPITMAGIWKGQFCGRCHDKVAFPTRNCFRCHSVPRTKK